VKARFLLICPRPGLFSWQADAVRLLLEDRHELSWAICFGMEVSKQPRPPTVPYDSVIPPGAVLTSHSHGPLELPSRTPPDLDFAVSFIPWDQLPGLPIKVRLGFWLWQFGDTMPGTVKHMAAAAIMSKQATMSARLIAWEPHAKNGRILFQGRFKVAKHSLNRTRERILGTCAGWPRRAWRELGDRPHLLANLEVWSPSEFKEARGLLPQIRLGVAVLRGIVERTVEEFLLEEKWTLGILDRPVTTFLSNTCLADVRWLPELPGGDYLADPMGLASRGDIVLAERYDARRGLGCIAAVKVNPPNDARIVRDEGVHLSYPLLVEEEGRRYCIPEQAVNGKVVLYRVEPFPDAWTQVATLHDNIAGADCTVFHDGNFWWMLGADHRDQDTVKLFGWYSTDLKGPWHPHQFNPLKIDAAGARPAGPVFSDHGTLYRPAQDCSGMYGGAVVIHRILELGPDRFREEVVSRIMPDRASPYPAGVHTITAAGERTVIDAKRHYLSMRKLWRTVRNLAREHWPALPHSNTVHGQAEG
jgi:hypothetical protein